MNSESPGFFRQLPSALPGLALIIVTMVVIRLWVEPWMKDAVINGQKGWLISVFHLNYILLGILCGMLYRNVIFGGKMPEVFSNGFKLSRLMIKSGIIMLGSLYTFSGHRPTGFHGDIPDRRLRDHDHHHGAVARQGFGP